jgi:hypothetical protein
LPGRSPRGGGAAAQPSASAHQTRTCPRRAGTAAQPSHQPRTQSMRLPGRRRGGGRLGFCAKRRCAISSLIPRFRR